MAIGRISGPLLKANLLRDGVDLAFETDLLYLDVNNLRVGIKTDNPQHELHVTGTTRTTNLEVENQLDIDDITITGNTITSNTGTLNLVTPETEFVVYQNKLKIDDIDIFDNQISTNSPNTNLEIRPNGTGTVDVYANTNVYGNIYATGNIRTDGNITIGDSTTDNIVINADIASDIIPNIDDTYSLGNSDKRWADVWTNNLYANVINTGDAIIDNINLNLRQGNIIYVAINGNDANSGTHQNDPYRTVKYALSQATAGDTVFIYPGTYAEEFPMTVPSGVTVRGMGIRSVRIVPTAATNDKDCFLLNGETTVEDLTIADFYSGASSYTVLLSGLTATEFQVNVGTSDFPHIYQSGGVVIKPDTTQLAITNAVYDENSGILTVTTATHGLSAGTVIKLKDIVFNCGGTETQTFPNNGYAFKFAPGFTVTTRSPYLRNITVKTLGSVLDPVTDPRGFNAGDAGKGAYLSGAVATAGSKEASCLFHSCTFITPGVDAIVMTNGIRVEWLNSFTYFANKGMYAFSGNYGLSGNGKTRIKIENTTGTWQVGDTITYYDTDGVTVLAQGVVESIDSDYYNIDGKSLGWETLGDRTGKTATVAGNAQLDTAEKKFGTASLALDGTGDYISFANQPDFGFGTDDFTIEGWFYRETTGVAVSLFDFRTAATQTAPWLYIGAGGGLLYVVNSTNRISTGSGTIGAGSWIHIALSRSGTDTRLFVNGTQVGSTYTDTNDYIQSPLTIGSRYTGANEFFDGYIDEVRITKGLARYTANFTAPTAPFTNDTSTVLLLHFNGIDGSTAIVDDGNTTQDIRSSSGGTASVIDFVNYTDFGAEIRSIASANVYGNYGVYGDGDGVVAYLIGQNLAYIGNGGSETNDPTTVIQANEIVELNRAKIYYNSVDHKGDFRVGDQFYVNQQTGEVTFSNSDIEFTNSLTFTDGLGNITFIDASRIETGNFRISGNTIETLTQDFNVVSASDVINLQNNVNIAGNLDVTGNVTIGGNITIGDENTDTIVIIAGVDSNIIPNIDNSYNLGTTDKRWQNLYTYRLDVGDVAIDNNVITTTGTNLDLRLTANGTGRIYVPTNNVEIDQDLTVNGDTFLKDTTVVGTITQTGDVDQTGNLTQTGDINLTGNLTVSEWAQFTDIRIDGNTVSTTLTNSDLELEANGTGRIYIPSNDVQINQDLTVNGFIYVNDLNVTTTITSDQFTTGDILIDDNIITTTVVNNDLRLTANGTGRIYVPANNVEIDQDLTVNGDTSLQDTSITGTVTHVGNTTQTGDLTQTGNIDLTGNLTVSEWAQFTDVRIDGNIVSTTLTNSDLQLQANGTGRIYVPTNDVEIDQDLTVNGVIYVNDLNVTTTITADQFTTGDILIDDNIITTTVVNNDLVLSANGTGRIYIPTNNVEIDQDLTVNGDTFLKDTTVVGTITQTGDITQTGNIELTGDLSLTGTLTVGSDAQFENILISQNNISTTVTNTDLELSAAGTGRIYISSNDVEITQTLTVTGLTSTTDIVNTGTVTSDQFTTGDILIDDNVIATTQSNSNLILSANGTGIVSIPTNDVQIDNNLTVDGQTTLANTNITGTVTHVGDTIQTGDVTHTGTYTVIGDINVSNVLQFENIKIDDNVITTTVTNDDLILQADGIGRIYIPSNDVEIDQDLTVNGLLTTVNIENNNTVTSPTFSTNNIEINENVIQTTQSNSNLILRAAGTGLVEIEQFEIQENEIRTSTNNDIILSPNGTGIVEVNSNQSIKLPIGTTGERPLVPAAGMIRFNTSLNRYEGYNGTDWLRLDGLYDLDENTYITPELTPGANDNTFRFVANGTQVADLDNTRLNVIKVTVDNIDIDNNVISTNTTNTDLILQTTGTGSVRIGNLAIRGSSITNVVPNAITTVTASGTGYFKIANTNGFAIPSGTTEQRPGQLEIGITRFNTTDGRLEIYDGIQWISAAGSSAGITAADAEDIAILAALMLG